MLFRSFYMSPEQVRQSKDIDARADQWSLGVVLYEALTGEKPFRSEVLLDLLEAITARDPTPLTAVRPALPRGLETVVATMMARDPAERFPSMRAVGAALWPFARPRTRALWARHFEREDDPAARLDDVLEARPSGFLAAAEAPPPAPPPTPPIDPVAPRPARGVAWAQVATGAAAGLVVGALAQREIGRAHV